MNRYLVSPYKRYKDTSTHFDNEHIAEQSDIFFILLEG